MLSSGLLSSIMFVSTEYTNCIITKIHVFFLQSFDIGQNTIATSYRGDDASGLNYGIYETGFLKFQAAGKYQAGRNFACLEVKCPGEPLDNETIPTKLHVPMIQRFL